MTMLASQITSLTVVYSIVYSGVHQRKHQSSASLAFVREIHRGPVNFPHKWPVTRKMFPFDDVIMNRDFHRLEHMLHQAQRGHCPIPVFTSILEIYHNNFMYKMSHVLFWLYHEFLLDELWTINDAHYFHYLRWSTLESLICPEGRVQMSL